MAALVPAVNRNTVLWHRWDRSPRPHEVRDLGEYRTGRDLHVALWNGGYTMLSSRRGRTLHRLASIVARDGVPGAVVDCGAWNGGSSILMAAGARERDVWVFDSFAGLPVPGPQDGPKSTASAGKCVGSEQKVRSGFEQFADPSRLHIRAGWFEDTLGPAAGEIGQVALLHCDGDWYDSVRLTLETFYPRVSPGGFVVIDDYGTWPGARRATDEFRTRAGDRARLHRIDHTGRYWRKTGS
jgi:O-methyltransferase